MKQVGSIGAYLKQHQEIYRFTHGMMAFRRAHPILSKEQFYTDAEIHLVQPATGIAQLGRPKGKRACLSDP